MRGARNAQVVRNDEGQIYAISLGADFVAEHEWGIKDTYRTFGIDASKIGTDPIGIDSRVNSRMPETLEITKHNDRKRPGGYSVGWKGTMLSMIRYPRDEERDPKDMREFYDSVGKDDDQEPLSTSWGDGDFAVFARKQDEQDFLGALYTAAENNDMVVWMGGGGVFENAGKCFGIKSRMPQEMIDEFAAADNAKISLDNADATTGIKARLEAAGEAAPKQGYTRAFSYYALSPRAINEEMQKERDTAHPVIYWLNPQDQDNVNFGWFTVEELDQWIAGEGPVPGGRNAKKSA